MVTTTQETIVLGTAGYIDTSENNNIAENASILVGLSFGSETDPLHQNIETMTSSDGSNDGQVNFGWQNAPYEAVNVDGTETGLDHGGQWTATIKYADPSIPDAVNAIVYIMQGDDGRLFFVAPPNGAPQSHFDAVSQYAIESIEITGVSNTTFSGMGTNRGDLVTFVPCFASGTMIETDSGQVAIEELAVGDLVMTKDNGLQPIRWIGSRALSADELAVNEKVQPIRIKAGALGNNTPEQDLLVSPQHRMLVRSKIAQRMFGTQEVLVAAKQLCQIDGIDVADDVTKVTYVHMLFDQHEVVIAEGAESESLYTGPQALEALGAAAAEEIFTLFPELRDRDYTPEGARVLASGRMARKLAVRHKQNNKQLVS